MCIRDSPIIDQTPKLYIGSKQKRPDSGYSMESFSFNNKFICDVARANRKDLRDTVEAASKAFSKQLTNFNRSQILFYLAENMSQRKDTFVNLLMNLSGINSLEAKKEFDLSCERIFYYASMSDKFEGVIHNPPMRGLTLAVKEPLGVITSILDDNQPLLSLSIVMSSIFTTGNANIIIPSEKTSLIATSMYQVFDTSDVPSGYINILTTKQNELNKIISEHENIDGICLFSENSNSASTVP